VATDLLTDFPPLKSLNVRPNNLPTQLSSFIGRAREIMEVKTLLASSRLVTLTGTGGSGKTRLALRAGADLLEQWSDGVWLVELASLSDGSVVPQPFATALAVSEQPRRSLTETLVNHLAPKSLLLIVDNCEHVRVPCAHLIDVLLRACPNLRILATSREPLGVDGELQCPVPTLSVPDPEQLPPTKDLTRYESVQLFAERARAALPTFRITPQNAKPVAQICHDLDGIPLAIELAAVRVKTLATHQIVARLSDRFRLLTGGGLTAPRRHQTLQAAMEWSYDLVAEKEKVVLRRLSVFAGGCTLAAAEAVCAERGEEAAEVLDLLGQLGDKSLLVAETQHGEARYLLLETVRQFGRQKLLDSEGEADVRRRHRDWYLGLAEQTEPKLDWSVGESDQVVWLDHLEREHDNLRAALEWSRKDGGEEEGLRLAVALGVFWLHQGYSSEGRKWLQGAMDRARTDAPLPLRAKALHLAARLAQSQADYCVARRFYEQSLAIYRDLDDKENIGRSLRRMGGMMVHQGDLLARPFLEESLAIFRQLGQTHDVAGTLVALGNLARLEGNYKTAQHLCEEGLSLLRNLGDIEGTAWALRYLGQATEGRGDLPKARRLFEESLSIFRKINEQMGIGWALEGMASVTCEMGERNAGRSLFEESFAIFDKLGEKEGVAWSLCGLGDVALSQGDHAAAKALNAKALVLFRQIELRPGVLRSLARLTEIAWACGHAPRAACLSGAADVLRGDLGGRHKVGRLQYVRTVAEVRVALGEEAFSAVSAEGRAMTLEQAIKYALADRPG
jgi:non-specific serine/threonine protein kinase